jgi:hypothetical protein
VNRGVVRNLVEQAGGLDPGWSRGADAPGARRPPLPKPTASYTSSAVERGGEPIDVGHSMVALYVLVKEDGRWWVAARQNTPVAT